MRYTELGTSNLRVSEIALGLMRISNKTTEEVVELLETAVDLGINFFDLADIYAGGVSEQKFGEALKASSIDRDKILVQTKTGIVQRTDGQNGMFDFSKEHILKTVDESLQRMQLDYVDTLLLHRPDALMEPAEIAETFNQLRQEGKVRYFGISNMNRYQTEYLQSFLNTDLVTNQLQFGLGHTGMVDFGLFTNMDVPEGHDHDSGLYPYIQQTGMTLQAWSPYQFGNFSGVFIDNPKFPELNAEMEKVAQNHGVTKNAVASAWILRLPASTQVIAGTTKPSRLKEIAAGTDFELSKGEWYNLYQASGHKLP